MKKSTLFLLLLLPVTLLANAQLCNNRTFSAAFTCTLNSGNPNSSYVALANWEHQPTCTVVSIRIDSGDYPGEIEYSTADDGEATLVGQNGNITLGDVTSSEGDAIYADANTDLTSQSDEYTIKCE